MQDQNWYLNLLTNRSFRGVNRIFVLSFQNDIGRISYTRYHIPLAKIKNCNVVIDRPNLFDQTVKNDLITYDNTGKITTSPGYDYTTGCLLDHNYFNNYCKMIAINLSKQQELDGNPKAI